MQNDSRKQKRLGPAPIASFEKSFDDNSIPASSISITIGDLKNNVITDDDHENMETIMDKSKDNIDINTTTISAGKILPIITNKTDEIIIGKKIKHQPLPPPLLITFGNNNSVQGNKNHKTLGLRTPTTPRIDISRASSSSQQDDSRDSSPDNVFEQVGTGTLQEAIGLGFNEEGTLDLRSSTEELYFMDSEQKKEEHDKLQQQQTRKSPIVFKFDEHQLYLQQHQRKDSASSEVAALLCISGRTSRVSSVGSQGSAISRLSAISGVSRSPSPHRVLLETSFCGPKPLENIIDASINNNIEPKTSDILEQVLLSRKQDPTQAVFAEGIKISDTPKKNLNSCQILDKNNLDIQKESSLNKINKKIKKINSGDILKKIEQQQQKQQKQVIGITPSGTEYIRIKLKPDYMYEDKGLAPNEQLIEIKSLNRNQIKPDTLNLDSKNDKKSISNISPKPNNQILLGNDVQTSRSPSPATLTTSRKNSFCSLFKGKESPDLIKERPRSRNKNKDNNLIQSQNPTPNKTKSVLAIFKPKRNCSKSISSSPIDHDIIVQQQFDNISNVEFKFKSDLNDIKNKTSNRLKYYDTPLDGKSIHIPLHTPPDEKSNQICNEIKDKSENLLKTKQYEQNESEIIVQKDDIEKIPELPIKLQKSNQLQQIENLDNIKIISLNVNDNINKSNIAEVQKKDNINKLENKIEENIENLDSSKITSLNDITENGINDKFRKNHIINKTITIQPKLTSEILQNREKRRILFATKIGSGSDEQLFSTQFSISKTESLCSQLSEQNSITDNLVIDVNEQLKRNDTIIHRIENNGKNNNNKPTVVGAIEKKNLTKLQSDDNDKFTTNVVMRKKESFDYLKGNTARNFDENDSTNRHSRYIENFDHMKNIQDDQLNKSKNNSDIISKEFDLNISSQDCQEKIISIENIDKTKSTISLCNRKQKTKIYDKNFVDQSSESEYDNQNDSKCIKKHLPHNICSIEDHESTGLVSQESFEDDLPYIPTTLPEERTLGISLIPMKERLKMDLKTCPVDRPRSTTPMNPSYLEDYCGTDDNDITIKCGEKLRISLPHKEINKEKIPNKNRSPRRLSNTNGKSWFEFAEQGMRRGSTTIITTTTTTTLTTNAIISTSIYSEQFDNNDIKLKISNPPPLPPRKPIITSQWIDLENLPEKRKPAKRITALPRDISDDFYKNNQQHIQYNYVKPEECQCECHEIERETNLKKNLVNVDLMQVEDLQPLIDVDTQEGIDPSDSSIEYSYDDDLRPKSYEKELSAGQCSSSRSSSYSQNTRSRRSTSEYKNK